MFELRIAEAIAEEAKLSQEYIQEGFSHAFKAGELIQEVRNMLNWKQERGEIMESWLEEHCSEVDISVLKNCMRLFNGETVSVQATKKATNEPQKRKRLN